MWLVSSKYEENPGQGIELGDSIAINRTQDKPPLISKTAVCISANSRSQKLVISVATKRDISADMEKKSVMTGLAAQISSACSSDPC